jgi:tetratricopeptide (TPR) repeat protein
VREAALLVLALVACGGAAAAGAPRAALATGAAPREPAAAVARPGAGGGEPEDLAARRAAVLALGDLGDAEALARALAWLEDPDAGVRGAVVVRLGAARPGSEAAGRRVAILAALAGEDPAAAVREAALEALATVAAEDPEAASSLAGLARALDPEGRRRAAALLAGELQLRSATARARLVEEVRGSARPGGEPLPADVLAAWLPAYGARLAEEPTGGEDAGGRAPLVLGLTSPEPAVRRAAEDGLERLLDRLRELERHERAERLLARLAEDGVEARPLVHARVRGWLAEGGVPPTAALEGARRLGRGRGDDGPVEDALWRARGAQLEAAALLALDRADAALAALDRAADLYDGLLARRLDGGGLAGASVQRELGQARAVVEFTRAFALAAGGAAGDDLALLARLREAHLHLLRAQRVATAAGLAVSQGLEPLLVGELGPQRLVFAARPHAAWPRTRALELQARLGRALATVAPREMPGFEPFEGLPEALSDPLADPARRALLEDLGRAELEALERRFDELRIERLKRPDQPGLEREVALVGFALRRLREELRDRPLEARYHDLRLPSAAALLLADALRGEDRPQEALELVERMRDALEEGELRQRYAWATRLAARAELSIGGSLSDADRPEEAEERLLAGLELLEGLRTFHLEREAQAVAAELDDERADALVSLAVNANVKARDPERALGFFERAYALRQDDFMRVLLACYRARSGRAEEARALVEDLPESPRSYYNLACTHALLGEVGEALRYLELDLTTNRPSRAALERQKAWARRDPDLASLREDPRFEVLTAPAPGEAGDGGG